MATPNEAMGNEMRMPCAAEGGPPNVTELKVGTRCTLGESTK